MKKFPVSVILYNIRSSHNVGSMFRTADALGVDTMFLVGFTPAPQDKFKRINKEIAKVALGGEQTVKWQSVNEVIPLISQLKKEGNRIVAVEQSARSTDYKDFTFSQPTAFIFGNEVEGIPEEVIAECDEVVEIPMRGGKESLNVSVAFGVALARILNL